MVYFTLPANITDWKKIIFQTGGGEWELICHANVHPCFLYCLHRTNLQGSVKENQQLKINYFQVESNIPKKMEGYFDIQFLKINKAIPSDDHL